MPPRLLDRHRLWVLFAVAVAARAATFGNPVIHVDEDFYFTAAAAMWRGALPYVDVWDRKPIGLFLLYLPPTALPFGAAIWAYQAMALGAVIATAWLIARLAARAGWPRGATLAGVAYILWLNVAGGQGGQSPVFYDLPVAGAAALIAGNAARRWRVDAAAMALIGAALQIKYSVVFEGMFFGLWIIARDWRAGDGLTRVAARAAGLAALALIPTVAALAYYAAIHQLDAFLYANFLSISTRRIDPPLERWGNLAKLVLFLSPLVALAFASRGAGEQGDRTVRLFVRLFVRSWFAVALAGVLVFGGWYEHYALPAMVPGTICAAGFFGTRRRGAAIVLGLVGLIGTVTVIANRIGRGGPAQFAALSEAVGHGPGCLWVYSGDAKLYAATGRCRLTRYIFPSHLYRAREAGAVGVDQATEVRRILALRPAVIVMRPFSIGERPEIRAIVIAAVGREYFLAARRPVGSEMVTVFRRR